MNYELQALMWNHNGSSDKIWGWVRAGDNYFCFWGRRQVVDHNGLVEGGKRPSLQFKYYTSLGSLENLKFQKFKKGYEIVNVENVDDKVPGFTDFFEHALVTARMTGKVKTDEWFAEN